MRVLVRVPDHTQDHIQHDLMSTEAKGGVHKTEAWDQKETYRELALES